MRVRWPIILAFLLVPGAAQAQELSVFLGRTEALNASGSSACRQVDFRYNPARHVAWSVSYVNEGHLKDHKRDGVVTQLWGRIPLFARRVSLDLGGGYHLWKEDRHEAESPGPEAGAEPSRKTGDEVMLFIGRTVVNSLEDQKGIASGVEFRKGIVRHLDWTLTWLNEGDPEVLRRNGLASQLWLVDYNTDTDVFVLGAGFRIK